MHADEDFINSFSIQDVMHKVSYFAIETFNLQVSDLRAAFLCSSSEESAAPKDMSRNWSPAASIG